MLWTKTHYHGVEIIASESQVPCRHPRYGYKSLIVLQRASLLLLSDDVQLVVCDDCGYNGITGAKPYVKPEGDYKPILKQADSLLAHKAGTHWSKAPRGPMYPENVIGTAVVVWHKWRTSGARDWSSRACQEMEQRGFTPHRGERWTSSLLGSLANRYEKDPKFEKIKAAVVSADQAASAALARMVRESSMRNVGARATTVAANVRITEKEPPQKPASALSVEVVLQQPANKPQSGQKKQEEANVPVAGSPTPKLSFERSSHFVGPTDVLDPVPVKTVAIDAELPPTPVASAPPSDYEHLVELQTGEPMFKYKKKLMVGKEVRGVEI